ncbi:response regulator transcription factor [Stakelama marina]|uniref:Response regulator n=1 Tax=Stakelama marina TaxID=2826939 RepID=A0A8T4I9D2_9SPHN|nr:response regulator [Stakelama marina]MBR0550971.1 response regulator [Stakelama marina]
MRSIYLVDDDDAVRASLHALLMVYQNTIIRGFRSGDAFLEELDDLGPGAVLLDFHMPGATGLDVLKQIGDRPEFSSVILTGQGDVQLAVQAMKAGAIDFLEKPYEPEELLKTVEIAFARLDEDGRAAARTETAKAKLERLSAREQDVLEGLIDGNSNKVIAQDLEISPRTVEIYRANMMEKLEVRSLSEALRVAFAAGMIED